VRECHAEATGITDPLDAILAEHQRQIALLDALKALLERLEEHSAAAEAKVLLRYLAEDLPLHMADEEEDLFPRLERRCRPEHGIRGILDQLSREHDLDSDLSAFLIEDLTRVADGLGLAHLTRLSLNASAFAETHRRHLDWENRVVLPLARELLGAEDLAAIGAGMTRRRGSRKS